MNDAGIHNMNDLISRQAAIDALWGALFSYEEKEEERFQKSGELDVYDWFAHRIFVQNMSDIDRQVIRELPSAQPEPIKINIDHELTKEEYEKLLKDMADAPIVLLPSAQPERKKGTWIADSGMIYCHECRYGYDGIFKRYYNFCPNCGSYNGGDEHVDE